MVRGRGNCHQPFVLAIERDLGFGNQLLEHGQQVRRRLLRERMKTQHRRIRAGRLRIELRKRVLDHLLIGREGQRHQAARLCLDAQQGVGHQRLEQGEHGRGIGRSDRIDHQLGLRGRGGQFELLDGRLDRLVVGG